MRGGRVFYGLYAGFVALIVLAVAIVGVMNARSIEQDTRTEIESALKARAELVRGLLIGSQPWSAVEIDSLQLSIRELGSKTETRLTLIDPDGLVLLDSEEDPGQMDNHGTRPEVLAARSHGAGVATRFSGTLGMDMMYVAIPVSGDGSTSGYVRASLPTTVIAERLSNLRGDILVGALVAAIVALPLGFLIARRVTAPLTAMTRLAGEIASGDYDQRARVHRSDEFGQLAGALNTMARRSQHRLDAVARERNRLQTILSGIVEGVVAVDAAETIIHMNAVAGTILDTDTEAAIGRPVREVTRASGMAELLTRALETGSPVTNVIRILGDQREHVIEGYAAPLRDSGDAVTGAVIVLHDVSNLRRLESVRQDFVANVSHELKTPITAVQGLVETMLADGSMTRDVQRSFLERVQRQVTRLTVLVGDLLTLSRLESEDTDPPRSVADLAKSVREVVATFAEPAGSRGLTLDARLTDVPLPIRCFAGALEQITSNLLDNAIKYTEKGGRVTVTVTPSESKAILSVEDTGIGIDPAHQARIFERFYRVDKARSRERGGTGLGLSIVKHLVRSTGGAIELISTPGTGSMFRVELPLVSRTAADAPEN